MEKDQKYLPSEKLQKEFEDNPMKILEILRSEEESNLNKSEEPKKDENLINSSSQEKSHELIKEKNKEESTEDDQFSKTFDFLKNEKHAQNDFYIKNNVNYIVNNINKVNSINKRNYKNSSINCGSIINYDKNIALNNLSIVFNFDKHSNNLSENDNVEYINKNIANKDQCINNSNNVSPKNNSEEANSTSSQSNDDEKINNNINNYNNNFNIITQKSIDNKKLLFSNINILLENLKTFRGSIICQEFIDNINNEKETSILFNNITPHICSIMCLEYGNYFFQKLLKKLNLEQKLIMYKLIEPNFYNIAANKFGTHSIQSLINNIQTPYELYSLYKLISKNMYFFFVDSNAYHIMMKIILDFPEEQRNPLNLFLVMNAEKIIINCNGAFCTNKFITRNKDLNLRALLIKNLQKNIKELIYNKFSCINLLLILETFGINWGKFIINEIQENFGVLC